MKRALSRGARAGGWALCAIAVVLALVAVAFRSGPGLGVARPEAWGAGERPVGDLDLAPAETRSRWGDRLEVDAGTLVVPERHEHPEGRRIVIAFRRLRSTASHPGAPILVLPGGPGSSGIDLGESGHFYVFRQLRELADVVLIDPRGIGRSIPNLDCGSSFDLPTDLETGIEAAVLDRIRHQVGRCLDRFRRRGVEVEAYQGVESADDLEALRAALGYERWTLLGFSYGTVLANVYARRHPERVDRLVLLGPAAPDLELKLPAAAELQYQALARYVREDRLYAAAIPDFEALVRRVHARLSETPAPIEVPLMDAVDDGDPPPLRAVFSMISLVRPSWSMVMGEFHLQLMLVDDLGHDAALARLPALYVRIDAGDYRAIGNRLRNFGRRRLPNAILVTTGCATGYTAARWAEAGAEGATSTLSRSALAFGRSEESCAVWKLPRQNPELLEPVGTDRPVLLVGGELDGRTPLAGVRELESRYPDHRTVVVRGAGHHGLLTGDVLRAIETFVAGDEPTTLESLVPFSLEPPVSLGDALPAAAYAAYLDSVAAGEALLDARLAEQAAAATWLFDLRERTLNSLGYRLLGEDRVAAALSVFRRNSELHPDSWNVWDSLAEAQARAGDAAAAIANYRRSVELNPLNGNGWHELARLEAEVGSAPAR